MMLKLVFSQIIEPSYLIRNIVLWIYFNCKFQNVTIFATRIPFTIFSQISLMLFFQFYAFLVCFSTFWTFIKIWHFRSHSELNKSTKINKRLTHIQQALQI